MKTLRLQKGESRIVAFTNGFITYGKNTQNNYRIEVNLFPTKMEDAIKIYEGDKRPIIRNIWFLTFIFSFLLPIAYLSYPIIVFSTIYLEGAINFVRNTAWQQSVREFNWINIIIIIVLIILLIFV